MKHLYLLRHAKASPADELGDHARPLAPQGIWAAEAMADHCRKWLREVDVALCSTAIRARETLRLFERSLAPSCKVRLDDELYFADRDALWAVLRAVDARCERLLVVGHEPGLSELAAALCGDAGSAKARRSLAKGLKTASLASIDVPIDAWSDARPAVGRLRAVIRPKDLR